MARLCYSNLNDMIFPLVPPNCQNTTGTRGTFTHHMYMWYYTVYSTALLHVVHDVVASLLGLQPFIYVGYHVHVIIDNICLYGTDGAVSICTNRLHCRPCLPHVAICS